MSDAREKFLGVLSGVLERFAFVFVEASDGDPGIAGFKDRLLQAAIMFRGKAEGAIALSAPAALCKEMAANILGMDPEEADDDAGEDALKEIVNVICGEMMPVLFGEKEVVDLTVPALCRIDSGKWQELAADPGTVKLWVEDQPILASLTVVNG
jgi:CheY-specific phosphatase CheX